MLVITRTRFLLFWPFGHIQPTLKAARWVWTHLQTPRKTEDLNVFLFLVIIAPFFYFLLLSPHLETKSKNWRNIGQLLSTTGPSERLSDIGVNMVSFRFAGSFGSCLLVSFSDVSSLRNCFSWFCETQTKCELTFQTLRTQLVLFKMEESVEATKTSAKHKTILSPLSLNGFNAPSRFTLTPTTVVGSKQLLYSQTFCRQTRAASPLPRSCSFHFTESVYALFSPRHRRALSDVLACHKPSPSRSTPPGEASPSLSQVITVKTLNCSSLSAIVRITKAAHYNVKFLYIDVSIFVYSIHRNLIYSLSFVKIWFLYELL